MKNRLVLALLGLPSMSSCILVSVIAKFFQVENSGLLNIVFFLFGVAGLVIIIVSLGGDTPRAVLDEIRSRSILKHFSEALSILCILVAGG